MSSPEETQLVAELDREISRKGSLFALVACLAVAAGLALAATLAIMPGAGG